VFILIFIVGGLLAGSVFTVKETEYAIRFQLGRIIKTDYEPGLHFKIPWVNNIRKFENRLLTLDTAPEAMITSEQKFVDVDSFSD
jgi:membrane protease subunit HflC